MSLLKHIQNYPKGHHPIVERLLSGLLVVWCVALVYANLHYRPGNAYFKLALAGFLGLILLWGVLSSIQNWMYYQGKDKNHPLDERQNQERFRVYFRSYLFLTFFLGLAAIAVQNNTFNVRTLLEQSEGSLIGITILWICFAIPPILGAWRKGPSYLFK